MALYLGNTADYRAPAFRGWKVFYPQRKSTDSLRKASFDARPPDQEYPFLLLTGRGTSSQWHTNTRTAKSDVLRKLYPANCYVEIHPDDADRLGITANSPMRVMSRRGELHATAFITPTVQTGQIFIPMHYREVNRLTFPAFDKYSRQPSYKACAVKITKC